MGRNPCQGARSDQRFPFRSCQRSCVRTPPIQEDPPSEDEGETCDVSVWPVWEYTTHDLSRGRRIFNPAHRPPVDCSALSASNTREQIPGASQPPGFLSADSAPWQGAFFSVREMVLDLAGQILWATNQHIMIYLAI